jgi:hypothetical protein
MVGARARVKPYPLPDRPIGAINVTDPDARTSCGRASTR